MFPLPGVSKCRSTTRDNLFGQRKKPKFKEIERSTKKRRDVFHSGRAEHCVPDASLMTGDPRP